MDTVSKKDSVKTSCMLSIATTKLDHKSIMRKNG